VSDVFVFGIASDVLFALLIYGSMALSDILCGLVIVNLMKPAINSADIVKSMPIRVLLIIILKVEVIFLLFLIKLFIDFIKGIRRKVDTAIPNVKDIRQGQE
jgi:hypothetical protein